MRSARIWWDDVWAAFTMVLLIIFMAAVEVHLQDPGALIVGLRPD